MPEKDFKILRLRSHKRRKKFAASKTIFLKRDIIFRFADIMAPIYKWSNRKIQDSPFTQVTFFEHVPQQQKKLLKLSNQELSSFSARPQEKHQLKQA